MFKIDRLSKFLTTFINVVEKKQHLIFTALLFALKLAPHYTRFQESQNSFELSTQK